MGRERKSLDSRFGRHPRFRTSHSLQPQPYIIVLVAICLSVNAYRLIVDYRRRCEMSQVTVIFIVIALCCLSLIVYFVAAFRVIEDYSVFIDTRSQTVDVDVCHNRHPLLSLINAVKLRIWHDYMQRNKYRHAYVYTIVHKRAGKKEESKNEEQENEKEQRR